MLYAAACVFLGLLAIRLVVGTDAFRGGLTPVAKTASAFLLGSGLLASVWLLVSLTPDRWFTPWVVTIVVGAALGLGVWDGLPLLRDTARQIGRAVAGAIRQLPWTWKIVVAVTAGLIAYYGLTCFLPPKGDAAAFYAALPKVIAHQWRLVILPGWRFWTVIGLHGEFHAAVFHLWGRPRRGPRCSCSRRPWPAWPCLRKSPANAGSGAAGNGSCCAWPSRRPPPPPSSPAGRSTGSAARWGSGPSSGPFRSGVAAGSGLS